MLRIHVSENASAAKQYYREGLNTSDYYVEKGVSKGYWGGLGAERLGLSGEVTSKAFDRLADNLHPMTGNKLTPRTKSNRRVGYDFTFNAPKSVSVLYALSDIDTKQMIRTAFEAAIISTVTELEQDMYTRVRKNNQNTERQTGNMVWGRFTHDTSRPIDGIPDPHLHTHVYVCNTTYDDAEGRWKAGEFGHIKSNAPYFEAVFHNHFASLLKSQGFGITPTKDRWEITGISDTIIREFSKRSHEIDLLATAKGITNAKQKAQLAAFSRASKQTIKPISEILTDWKTRYFQHGGLNLNEIKAIQHDKEPTLNNIINQTLNHVFERDAVVPTKKVITTALQYGVGHISQADIYQSLYTREAIFRKIDGVEYMTMPHIIKQEKQLIHSVKHGRGKFKPFTTEPISIKASFLNKQQQQAVRHVLASTDFVTAILGKAGVGKTTTMKELKQQLQEHGKQVFAFTSSTDASRGTLAQEGFTNATTIAALLKNETLQQQLRHNIMWIDEASQVGTATMNHLLTIAKKQQARVILSGDIMQHGSVERGNSFNLLAAHAGMNSVTIGTIIRQKHSFYRNAVHAIEQGKITQAIEWLHTIDGFCEITDAQTRYQTLADDYFHIINKGQSALVISPTHFEGEQVLPRIRERLKLAGHIRGITQNRLQLKPLHLTETQKKQAHEYVPGYFIQLTQNIKGYTRGDILQVITNHNRDYLMVKETNETELKTLLLKHSKHFEVYTPGRIEVAKGDRIRITRNGYTKYKRHRINNGSEYQVERVKRNGDIILNNGWELDKDFPHLAYGYISTSYASQSKTVDQVLIAQSQISYGKATSKQQFYVSLSRGKHGVKVYTDDINGLKKELTKGQQTLSAVDLSNKSQKSSWFKHMKQAMRRYQHHKQPFIKPHMAHHHVKRI